VGAGAAGAPRPRGPEGGGTVLFDVETIRSAAEVGGWHRAHRMGIAIAVALHLEEGRFRTFREPEVAELVALLKSAALVVGFNSRRFDYAVLGGYTGEDYGRTLPTLDLLESLHGVLGFRVGLGHLAQETLGRGKSADGLQSLEWVKQGRLDLVEDYCRQDVEVMRDVYLFGRREGYVLIADRVAGRVRVPVDW
jgi:DEAD/DEAH box helicase domain-containing protein